MKIAYFYVYALSLHFLCLTFMAQVRHLWRSFMREDERGSGRIAYDRVKAILRSLNIYRDKRTLRSLFSSIDEHATGTIAFDQFVQVCAG